MLEGEDERDGGAVEMLRDRGVQMTVEREYKAVKGGSR